MAGSQVKRMPVRPKSVRFYAANALGNPARDLLVVIIAEWEKSEDIITGRLEIGL
ncbi:MAG: hypothetical protein ABSH16_07625 [Sedimentisphaerales bacterium]